MAKERRIVSEDPKITPATPRGPFTLPDEEDKAPSSLPDNRPMIDRVKDKAKQILDSASESEVVDIATNAAAESVREYGSKNTRNLAKKLDHFFDEYVVPNAPAFLRPILRRLPLARLIGTQMDKLVALVADWLNDFSDASEEDEA